MAETTVKNPVLEFNNLPEPLQEWLSSERVTQQIIIINERLGTVGSSARIIPSLLYRLVTKRLDARDFINQLHAELKISLVEAKIVTQEIDQVILRPIRGQLKNAIDLDINLLYAWEPKQATPSIGEIAEEEPKTPFVAPSPTTPTPTQGSGQTSELPKNPWPQANFFPATPTPVAKPPASKPTFTPLEIKPAEASKPVAPAKPMVETPLGRSPTGEAKNDAPRIIPTVATNPVIANAIRAATAPAPMPLPDAQPPTASPAAPKPFILHEEKSEIKSTMEAAPQAPRPSLTFKVPVSLAKPAPQKVTHKPLNVAIESPFEEKKPEEQVGTTIRPGEQQRRVVHYSDLRTPVDPFADMNKQQK